ncbi:MAG: CARDB domain-containing protein [Vulcanimicrobiota bacterium]
MMPGQFRLLPKYFVAIILLLTQLSAAQDWQGTWSSSYGELRLYEVGKYVIGDYSSVGLIFAEKRFDLLEGTFTNAGHAKAGKITFKMESPGEFIGSWSYPPSTTLKDWKGTRTSSTAPDLKNFLSKNQPLKPISNSRKVVDGVYQSSLGEVRLETQDNFLMGDNADKGVIVGLWNSNHYAGHFTDNGRLGWFRLYFNSANGSFSKGEYGWYRDAKVYPWTLSRSSQASPDLTNVAPQSPSSQVSLDASPQSTTNSTTGNTSNTAPLPDLMVERVYLNAQGQVTVRLKNMGGRVPDDVWTHRRPQSSSVYLDANQRPWGGMTLWSLDPERRLQNSQGSLEWTSDLKVAPGSQVTVKIDSTNQIVESNKANNTYSTQVASTNVAPPQNPPATRVEQSTGPFLSPTKDFNMDRVRTIKTMQQHVSWVSLPSEAEVLKALRDNGYEVVGNSLITSNSNDADSRFYHTDRLRAYVAVSGNDIVVSFRGSEAGKIWTQGHKTAGNILTDATAFKTTPSFVFPTSKQQGLASRVEVHRGFNKAYDRLREQIINALVQHQGKNLYIFGHSLGGAQATLCSFDVNLNFDRKFANHTLIVSGSPRVGDLNFRNFYEYLSPGALRVVVQGDPVPRVPGSRWYVHVGDLINLELDGSITRPTEIISDLVVDVMSNLQEGQLRNWKWKNHDKDVYKNAVDGLVYKASASDFFQYKERLPKASGDAERKL